MTNGTLSSLDLFAYHLPSSFVAFAGITSSASASYILLLSITSGGLLSAVLGCFLFLVVGDSLLSAVFSCFLFFVAGGGLLSVFFCCLLSFIARSHLLFAVFDCFLSLIAGDSSLSTIFGSDLLFFMPFTSSRALFFTSTPSCICHSFLLFCHFLFFVVLFAYTAYL